MINNLKNLKKTIFGLLALVMVFGLVLTTSAFKHEQQSESKKRVTVYFKYNGSTFNESAYRDISNWEHTDNPGEVECGGDENICILRVDSDNLTAPGSMEDKLDDFFNEQLDSPGQVQTYVTTTANIEAQQN